MQIFARGWNTFAWASLVGLVLLLAVLSYGLAGFYRSAYVTTATITVEQPVPFSHEHHAGRLGIDCRFCHASVEESSLTTRRSTSRPRCPRALPSQNGTFVLTFCGCEGASSRSRLASAAGS